MTDRHGLYDKWEREGGPALVGPMPDRQTVTVKLPNGLVFQKFGNEWAWVDPQGGFLPVVSDRLEEGGFGIVLTKDSLFTALLSMQTERDAERAGREQAEASLVRLRSVVWRMLDGEPCALDIVTGQPNVEMLIDRSVLVEASGLINGYNRDGYPQGEER